MNPLSLLRISLAALLAPALLLSGCAGGFSVPDTNVVQQSPVGAMQGSVYGGHAPLTQAHVYMLQPSTTGYGNQATSLLNASSSTVPGSQTFTNPSTGGDPGIPAGWIYIETDGSGQFNLTGDYTCTAGLPVYLYSFGGFADFPQSSGYGTNNTFNINSVTVSGTGPYTYTFTTATAQYGYAGETVYFNQTYGPFTGGTDYLMASWVSPTQFTLTASTSSNPSPSGLQANIVPNYNNAAVELAVLGVCPSTGSLQAGGLLFNGTTSSPINYIYMNEVSTVAAAYAFAPFSFNGYAFDPTRNNATWIGTSSTNLVGLQNAALNAGILYSVNGSGPLSTTYAGEGHIANATTPTGNGIINQVTIDTVANILAACVDSLNSATTMTVGAAGVSTQCSTLFQYATSTGIPTTDSNPGTQPYDTAMAAIYIALHPQGPPSIDTTTTPAQWVTALYNINNGIVPFAPHLNDVPNDFTIGILYPETSNGKCCGGSGPYYLEGVSYLAVDKIGEVWFTGPGNGTSNHGIDFMMSPQGVINTSTATYLPNGYASGPPVIDSNGNVWIQTQNATGGTYFIQATNTSSNPYVYATGVTAATFASNPLFIPGTQAYFGDASGDMYFVHGFKSGTSTSPFDLTEFSAVSGGSSSEADTQQIPNFVNTNYPIVAGALDNQGYAWLVQNATGSNSSYFSRIGPVTSPTPPSSFYVTGTGTGSCTGLFAPTSVAITRYGNALVATSYEFAVTFTTSSGTCTQITNSSGNTLNRTGPGSWYPVSEAADGNDYVYSLNQETSSSTTSHQGSITVFNMRGEPEASGMGSVSSTYAMNFALSPVYYPSGSSTLTSLLSYPQSMALDPSGNIWVTNSTTSGSNPQSIVEIIGAAGPTTTPLAGAINSNCQTSIVVGCIAYRP